MAGDEYRGRIRQQPIAIKAIISEDPKSVWQRWDRIAVSLQRVLNRLWFEFELWHHQRGHGDQIRLWMDELKLWHASDSKARGAKPKCPVVPVPPALAKIWERDLRLLAWDVNSRTVGLAINREQKHLLKQPGSNSAFPRWQLVLAGLGQRPSFSRPLPIPFDVKNAPLPRQEEGRWLMTLRLDRFERTSKQGRRVATSHTDTVVLDTFGRHKARLAKMLQRCATGEWKYCGSMLSCDRGRWFVQFCYRERKLEPAAVQYDRTVVLVPMRGEPWRFRAFGRTHFWLGGRGWHVRHIRRQLRQMQCSRNNSYRYGHRKGHGRKRAMHFRGVNLEDKFKKTYNEQTAAALLDYMVNNGVGVLMFRKPQGRREASRYLITAGATPRRPGQWPWFQMELLLKRKCEERGIVFATSLGELKRAKAKLRQAVTPYEV